eukprot:CAMPEP_0172739004 /NCGR_PEP_ID=MMETSP1074-20121228/121533_1 /TAXON_ID=2916 /ORGANISM="Ceratium fusus, Strain PA161109" /LENGTH=59 /DNA_ID=CAMNT_0013568763 /DNA_START=86 /DNA_END=262 /DNA_ORIENTATION=-
MSAESVRFPGTVDEDSEVTMAEIVSGGASEQATAASRCCVMTSHSLAQQTEMCSVVGMQ